MRRKFLCAAIFLAVFGMTGASHAKSPERPMIQVGCIPEAMSQDALCRAVVQAIADAAVGGAVIRQADGDPTRRSAALDISFVLDARDDHGIAGHLEWQAGQQSDPAVGPQIRLDVMDARVSPAMYANFARSLVEATTALHAPLRGETTD